MIALQNLKNCRRVLLLQGPMGFFFTKLRNYLQAQRITCYKINFNGGDQFFYPKDANTISYRGAQHEYKIWLSKYLLDNEIDAIVCFGDCRFYHRKAKQVAHTLGIRFFVFEEGYIRPNYITFEENGVNSHSTTVFEPIKMHSQQAVSAQPVYSKHWLLIFSAVVYFIANIIYSWKYPHYKHHRQLSTWQEFLALFISAGRRITRYIPDRLAEKKLQKELKGKYFIATLQVHNDSQVHFHSDFDDVLHFIEKVITSFAKHAPQDIHLAIKHHPMDRGYRNYGQHITNVAKRYGIESRIIYVWDVHLPTLIKNSLGLVTINSTTGLQSLYHSKPVKVLGRAIYNRPNITSTDSLDIFWCRTQPVNVLYFKAFKQELIKKTLLNGSFYGKCYWMQKNANSEALNINKELPLKSRL